MKENWKGEQTRKMGLRASPGCVGPLRRRIDTLLVWYWLAVGKAVPSTLIMGCGCGAVLTDGNSGGARLCCCVLPFMDGLVAAGPGDRLRCYLSLYPRFAGTVVLTPAHFLYSASHIPVIRVFVVL